MFKTILKILAWLLMVAVIGFIGWFAERQLAGVRCQNVSVQIIEGSPRYLDEDDILELIKNADKTIFGKKLDQINTDVLERKLNAVECIKNAEVYRRINEKSLKFEGKLVVEITERNPIVRIKTAEFDYYLDCEGMKIPVTEKISAKVLVVSGTVTSEYAISELLGFAGYVWNDPFWKAQIEQVFVKPDKELLVVPRIGNHLIEFGTAENFQEKLRNLKAVYQLGFSKTGWEKYKNINLKYKNQVVCTKS